MMRKAVPGKSQSTIGLFQALGVDAGAVPRTRPMYRTLVDLIERGLSRGSLGAGFQLPPERDLARALRVSRTTVVSAYRELEARGLVRGYVGRGTFVSARPDPGSAPFAWRGKVAAAALQSDDATVKELLRVAADSTLTSFAAGQPALDRFPTAAFQQAVDTILRRDATAVWRHAPTEGHARLRAAIGTRFGGLADDILVISGAQQGLDLLARCLIDPGDTVIIDRPGYLGAIHSFRSAGAHLVGWDVRRADVDELEESLLRYRPKLIYLNPTYQNPTGVTLPIRVRREILDLAERYRVPIIEDDTYRELALNTPPPPSLHQLDEMRNVVIHVNTFSKMLAPGLRLGWIAAARPIVEQLALIKQRVDLHTQTLSQLVVADLLESGAFDRHVAGLRGEHRRRRDAMVQALGAHVRPGELRFATPEGGMFLWCQLTGQLRADVVQQYALRDGIVFVSGAAFYPDRGGAQELRLCYTAQPPEAAVLGAQCLARSIAEARRQTVRQAPVIPIPMA